MSNPSFDQSTNTSELDLEGLVEAVSNAVAVSYQTGDTASALTIRDQLRRLPDYFVTEVLNGVILKLVGIDPDLCRWFILDIFLRDADMEGRADVAERINLMLADLRSQSS